MSQAVFRHYDKRALDAEYNNRAKVKNAMEWMARYGGESARVRAELPMRFDVPYGPHHGERLDVFLPDGPGPAPVHVFIHGGYWHRLDKADFSFVVRGLRPAGAVTVVVNYGLIPAIDMDTLVRQCRTAVAWVHAHAAEIGGDPARIFVSGHSAGGHLTAMLLATDWTTLGRPADVVKGGVAISGLYDLEPIRLAAPARPRCRGAAGRHPANGLCPCQCKTAVSTGGHRAGQRRFPKRSSCVDQRPGPFTD